MIILLEIKKKVSRSMQLYILSSSVGPVHFEGKFIFHCILLGTFINDLKT